MWSYSEIWMGAVVKYGLIGMKLTNKLRCVQNIVVQNCIITPVYLWYLLV